jgi:1-acyl-sn-glycerol-3-phosphate acyltransferase
MREKIPGTAGPESTQPEVDLGELSPVLGRAQRLLKVLAFYHRHKVQGMDNIPKTGPFILATHHSLATYDGFILGMTIFEQTGRLIRGLGDDLLFRLPFTKNWIGELGIEPAGPEAARNLLLAGHGVGLAPGGMRESLRPSSQRFQILWKKRKGFVRLAMELNVPIILAACPRADLVYDVFPSKLTAFAYKHLHLPVPLVKGLGPTLIPKPVQLIHYLSEPLWPPKDSEDVEAFHQQIVKRMELMMENGKI